MNLNIEWQNIVLVWNRWFKNLWDELILVWLMKILLNQNKNIFISCTNKNRLKNFHKQFFDNFETLLKNKKIVYIQELPKWFWSLIKFIKNITDFKYWLKSNTIVIWWGEIFTEETKFSYRYWLLSSFPVFFWKKLYLMWWIQIPQKIINKIPFNILTKKSIKIFVRDNWLKNTKLEWKTEFFKDTSFFVPLKQNYYSLDYKSNKRINKENFSTKKQIIVNCNKKADKHFNEIKEITEKYYKQNYDVWFARICKSYKDNDIVYYQELKKIFPNVKLLDRENNFYGFCKKLEESEIVFATRLHLILVWFYLNCNLKTFEYEKKVKKIKEILKLKE